MILKLEILPTQFEALAIVLKAMKIRFAIETADEAYEKKVDENLLKMMLEDEREGNEVLGHVQTMNWLHEERKALGI